MASCVRCIVEQHNSCLEWNEDEDSCCDNGESQVSVPVLITDTKDDSQLKDPESTGRKRAKKAKPLDYNAPCEWVGLKFAGGGKFPIVGCRPEEKHTQTNIHHGPDKSTLNNSWENLHRICSWCHNRWHAKNDPVYEARIIQVPHDPVTLADDNDLNLARVEEVQTDLVIPNGEH